MEKYTSLRQPSRRKRCAALCALALSFTAGCTPGILYTDITYPLSLNMRGTPNPTDVKRGEEYVEKVTEPLTGYGLQVEVGETGGIGDAVKRAGIEEIYYVDERLVSVIGGLYEKRTLIVTGR